MAPVPVDSPFLPEAPIAIQNQGVITSPLHGMEDTRQYYNSFLVQGGYPQQQSQERQMQELHHLHLQQQDYLLRFQQQQQHQLKIQQLQEVQEMMKQQISVLGSSQPWRSHSSRALNKTFCQPSSNTGIVDHHQASDEPRGSTEDNGDEECTSTPCQGNDNEGHIGAPSQTFDADFTPGTERRNLSSAPNVPTHMNETATKRCRMTNVTAPSPGTTATTAAPVYPCHQDEKQNGEHGGESHEQNKSSMNVIAPFSFSPCPPRKVSPKEQWNRSEEEGHVNEVLKKQLEDHEKNSKPRRPLTAYNFYFSEERERLLAQIPEISIEEQRRIGELSPSCRNASSETIEEALHKLKEKIAKAPKLKKKEQDALDELVRMKTKSTLDAHRERDRRRRPHRKEHGKVSFHLLSSLIGERWKCLPKSDRAFYQGLAEQDLGRYRWGMIIYERQRKRIRDQFLCREKR